MARFDFREAVIGELAPVLAAEMHAFAEIAVEEAKAIAPVGDPSEDPTTGSFRDSIHVEATAGGAQVVSDDPAAIYIEAGTSDTPPWGTLRRGVELASRKLGPS